MDRMDKEIMLCMVEEERVLGSAHELDGGWMVGVREMTHLQLPKLCEAVLEMTSREGRL